MARDSWEGTYSGGATQDFDPGAGADTVQTIGTIAAMSSGQIDLQWAEPWGHATSDFAIDVYTISGGTPTFAFTTDTNNLVSGLPSEFAVISNSGGSAVTVGIAIRRVAGGGAPFLKYILLGAITADIQLPDELERDRPGRGGGERRAHGRRLGRTGRRRRPRRSARAGPSRTCST